MWPWSSTNFSGSTVPRISATSTGIGRQPSSSFVEYRTFTAPDCARSRSQFPSLVFTARTGIFGLRRPRRRGEPLQPGAAGHADEQFGFVQGVGHAPLRQLLDDVLDPAAFRLAP